MTSFKIKAPLQRGFSLVYKTPPPVYRNEEWLKRSDISSNKILLPKTRGNNPVIEVPSWMVVFKTAQCHVGDIL